ncbi:MAG: alpha/beta fold hydrolase [Acidimicrobiia bacterium]
MGNYATVGPVRMYYETEGDQGRPLLLLHGAMGGAFSWQREIEALSARYRLFVPEQRGRARTADVPGPISYQAMTDDTLGFIVSVVREPVYLVGASDGGIIGLLAALKRPDIVQKLVVIGANYHYDGLVANSGFGLPAEDEAWAVPRERYGQLSPDGPDHWQEIDRPKPIVRFDLILAPIRRPPTRPSSSRNSNSTDAEQAFCLEPPFASCRSVPARWRATN